MTKQKDKDWLEQTWEIKEKLSKKFENTSFKKQYTEMAKEADKALKRRKAKAGK